MTETEALKLFKKKYPKLTATKIVNADKNHFLVVAFEDINKKYEEIDPYYYIDKTTKEIGFYTITDIIEFSKLINSN